MEKVRNRDGADAPDVDVGGDAASPAPKNEKECVYVKWNSKENDSQEKLDYTREKSYKWG